MEAAGVGGGHDELGHALELHAAVHLLPFIVLLYW
jgi:hypothetical protein